LDHLLQRGTNLISPAILRKTSIVSRIQLISDLLVEYAERDEKEGRILVRPAVGRNLPFGDGFEKLLLAWSFLNVMGYVLVLSFQTTTSI
jgi:hypothetical protein